jgi:hypothetical protein
MESLLWRKVLVAKEGHLFVVLVAQVLYERPQNVVDGLDVVHVVVTGHGDTHERLGAVELVATGKVSTDRHTREAVSYMIF